MKLVLPLIFTRRIGAACETAQNSVCAAASALAGDVDVRLEMDRQKFTSAMQLSAARHRL